MLVTLFQAQILATENNIKKAIWLKQISRLLQQYSSKIVETSSSLIL